MLLDSGSLTEENIEQLAKLCEVEHGIEHVLPAVRGDEVPSESGDEVPSESGDEVPSESDDEGHSTAVVLESVGNICNANLLAEGQSLPFLPKGLTVVYGDNASGKSGYTRILKQFCRARRSEPIRASIYSDDGEIPATAMVTYTVGEKSRTFEWQDGQNNLPRELKNILVFDAHCGGFYLDEEMDAIFRPFGLDLFDKMVGACLRLRSLIDSKLEKVNSRTIDLSALTGDTIVGKLIDRLDTATVEEVESLATLSESESQRLKVLSKTVIDLKAANPRQIAIQLRLQKGRVDAFARRVSEIETELSKDSATALQSACKLASTTAKTAEIASDKTFPSILSNPGGEVWMALWTAARNYSLQVYPEQDFPYTEGEARCVLCEQQLSQEATQRLQAFDAFVSDEIQKNAREAESSYSTLRKKILSVDTEIGESENTIKEIESEYKEFAAAVRASFLSAESRKQALLEACSNGSWEGIAPLPPSLVEQLQMISQNLDSRAEPLMKADLLTTADKTGVELAELGARVLLQQKKEDVLAERERQQLAAKLRNSLSDTRTTQITNQSTDLTKEYVTDRLATAFVNEVKGLHLPFLKVELVPTRGEHAALYHRIQFTDAKGEKLREVASDGEQKCIALAAFLTELATADHQSGDLPLYSVPT